MIPCTLTDHETVKYHKKETFVHAVIFVEFSFYNSNDFCTASDETLAAPLLGNRSQVVELCRFLVKICSREEMVHKCLGCRSGRCAFRRQIKQHGCLL